MAKTYQIMSMNDNGFSVKVIKVVGDNNPYHVYRVWRGHRRLIAKYGDYFSVICFLHDIYRWGMDTVPVNELVEWAKNYHKGV